MKTTKLLGMTFMLCFFCVTMIIIAHINFTEPVVVPAQPEPSVAEQPEEVRVEQPQLIERKSKTHEIKLYEDRSQPSEVTIFVGDAVTWVRTRRRCLARIIHEANRPAGDPLV